jgi:hypothetical protein
MTPAFFAPQLKTFLPMFLNVALKVGHPFDLDIHLLKKLSGSPQLTQKWKDEVISLDPTGQPVINVTQWLSRTTLDIIGESKCSASVKTLFT